jgi:hypothetical protein
MLIFVFSETWGSQVVENVGYGLQGCDAILFSSVPAFRRNVANYLRD